MSKIKSYAVIGLGVFGRSVARTLAQEGMEVMVIDHNKDKVNELAAEVTYAMQIDVTNEIALKNSGINRMDGVIIAIGEELEPTVMATILCSEMGIGEIIVKAETTLQQRILEKVGATKVILPEKESGYRLAKNIAGNFRDFFQLSDTMSMVECPVKAEWTDKSIRELKLREDYHLSVIAIRRADQDQMEVTPRPDRKLRAGDLILLVGKEEDIQKL